jgi:glutamate-1-semialdehyde 2,1-aminomutase
MMEVELAEKIVQHVPCAEKVRFSITGSDAVQLAVRLARAYTKRPYFIRFEGHYHGWLDNMLGGLVNPNVPERPWPVESEEDVFGTAGRAPEVFNQSMMLPWNDVEVLESTLKKYGDQVAMIHMEPILCNGECCHALPGYLKKVRQLCDQYGIVMSFDEVITGFRVGLGGAQELLGVTPDIATFGKALSGGAMPVSAVAGKRDILDLLDQGEVVGAGTFNGYPLGLAAALATVKILEKDNGAIYRRIDASQKRLTDGLKGLMANKGIPMLIQQARGIFYTLFSKKKEAHSVRDLDDMDVGKQMKLFYKMAEEGIILMLAGRWYVSGAIDDADVDRALDAMERVLPKL